MSSRDFQDYRILYYHLLEKILRQNHNHDATEIVIRNFWSENDNLGIMYVYRPELHQLILLEPIREQDELSELKLRYEPIIADAQQNPEHLLRKVARSYPALITLDRDAWLTIQKDEEANLALSPEEADLLESIRFPHRSESHNASRYPLFINGRAGSGKSTMLQYLMADYLDFALRRPTGLLPLYMTCSAELLKEARKVVRALLSCHHERLLNRDQIYNNLVNIDNTLNRCFVVFHDFLYKLLSDNQRKRFSPEKYISYYSFCRLWEKQFCRNPISRQLSVDVAWHTIRSFIKGRRSDLEDDFGPDDFGAMPEKRRSISMDTYKLIYSSVWEGWYKRLCEEGYWDDQDLAVAVLGSDSLEPLTFGAIFCDEAQDFTAVEIELILRLSVFSRRLLSPEQLSAVPFVFAGDPLQTINPTGFRWENVTAEFYERFMAILDPRRRATLQINYQELRYNYRSNPGIVNFCNLIQLLRAALFQDRSIRPQEAWWIRPPSKVVWYDATTPATGELIRQHPEMIKIINCNEGQESDFAQEDKLLTKITHMGGVYRNILSPMRAKGLEFSAVVLYRFGQDSSVHALRQLFNGVCELANNQEAKLPLEYFLNRLYVAASRAKNQLIIVDTSESLENFWQFATDQGAIEDLLKRVPCPDIWRKQITPMVIDEYGGVLGTGEATDLRQQGQEFAKQGNLKRDPYLLRQAAMAFDNAGEIFEASKCRAKAFEFESEYTEAGKSFEELGLYQDALKCYWQGKKYYKITELTSKDPSLVGSIESRAADFMQKKQELPDEFLAAILSFVHDQIWLEKNYEDPTWRDIFIALARKLAELPPERQDDWKRIHAMTEELARKRIPLEAKHRAYIAYRAGKYQRAKELFEEANITDPPEYLRTRAHLEAFPHNVIWFYKLKDHATIMEEWGARKNDSALAAELLKNRNAVLAVIDAALETNDLHCALDLLQKQPDQDRIRQLLTKSVTQGNATAACETVIIAVPLLVKEKKWQEIIQLAEKGVFPGLSADQSNDLQMLLQKNLGLQKVFDAAIHALASSEELAYEKSNLQATVSDFLYRHFIADKSWRTMKPNLPLAVVGAAIERAGRIVYALQYYEDLIKDRNLTPAQQNFVAERLAVSYERHINYLQKANDISRATDAVKRVQALRAQYNIRGDLPTFPYLAKDILELGGPTEYQQRPFKITISQQHQKIRIEHRDRFAVVTLNYKDRNIQGEGNFEPLSNGNGWHSSDWNLTLKLIEKGNSLHLQGKYDDKFFDIPLY